MILLQRDKILSSQTKSLLKTIPKPHCSLADTEQYYMSTLIEAKNDSPQRFEPNQLQTAIRTQIQIQETGFCSKKRRHFF